MTNFWPVANLPIETRAFNLLEPVPLLAAVVGGLTVGLGGMLWALGTWVSPLSEPAARRVALVATGVWFLVDSAGSISVGAPTNLLVNILFAAIVVIAAR